MSDYIKREDAINLIADIETEDDCPCGRGYAEFIFHRIPTADVVEVGKPYKREEMNKYRLVEWKDKEGQRWVMIEHE